MGKAYHNPAGALSPLNPQGELQRTPKECHNQRSQTHIASNIN